MSGIAWSMQRMVVAAVFVAQTASPAGPSMEQANQAYSTKNWNTSADAFGVITKADPANALAWLRLGVSLHKLQKYDEALAAFKRIESDSQLGASAFYREAETLTKLNRKDDAFLALNKAVDAGFVQTDLIQKDDDLIPLHEDPAFKKIIDKADAVAHPCAHQPEYRQFDFWIGEWDVFTTQGHNPAGTSSIQLILDQCVILENWTGGGTGKSFNHYDTRLKKWIQDWVDSQSNSVHFEGRLENGVMSYFADSADARGSPIRRHMQFVPIDADHVRQYSQASSDHGKSWTMEYDFTYVRKK